MNNPINYIAIKVFQANPFYPSMALMFSSSIFSDKTSQAPRANAISHLSQTS